MLTRKHLLAGAAGALLLATPVATIADGNDKERSPQGQYRHNLMEVVKYSFLNVMLNLRGEVSAPADQIAGHAEALATAASMAAGAFEKDTRGEDGATDARDAVWENWSDFSARLATFEADTAALAEAAQSGDRAAIAAAFKKVGGSCKSCHDEYRKD